MGKRIDSAEEREGLYHLHLEVYKSAQVHVVGVLKNKVKEI